MVIKNMQIADITSSKLRRLMNESINVGGELKLIMEDSLENSKTEKDFEFAWFRNLRNFINHVIVFHNELAEATDGYDSYRVIS